MDEINGYALKIGMAMQNITFAVANTPEDERVCRKLKEIESNLVAIIDVIKAAKEEGDNK